MKKIYILAAAAAIITAILLYFYLDSLTENKDGQQDSVVIAIVDIPAYTKITADMIATVEMPTSAIHANAIHNRADAMGMVNSTDIVAGEVLLSQKVKEMGNSNNALAYLVEEGMRAVTIEVDKVSGVGGYIRQGDRVDVLATIDIPSTTVANSDTVITSVIAADIEVIAVGNTIADTTNAESGAVEYVTITLMAKPEIAQKIVFSTVEGRVNLILRSVTDHSIQKNTKIYRNSKILSI